MISKLRFKNSFVTQNYCKNPERNPDRINMDVLMNVRRPGNLEWRASSEIIGKSSEEYAKLVGRALSLILEFPFTQYAFGIVSFPLPMWNEQNRWPVLVCVTPASPNLAIWPLLRSLYFTSLSSALYAESWHRGVVRWMATAGRQATGTNPFDFSQFKRGICDLWGSTVI